MTAPYIGLDLNGGIDRAVSVTGPLDREATLLHSIDVPVTIVPEEGREKVLCGGQAASSIDGRGWQWPDQARLEGRRSARIPVIELLKAATDGLPSIDTRYGLRSTENLLGAHLRHLAGAAPSACIAIPDGFSEDAQEVLIGAGRRAVSMSNHRRSGLAVQLLWRPVAALLGWAQGQPDSVISGLHGRSAVVLQRLPQGVAATCLDLEVDSTTGPAPLLTPVRTRAGEFRAGSVAPLALAEETADRVASASGDDSLRWQALWGSTLAWQPVLGRLAAPVLLQRQTGVWMIADAAPPLDPDIPSEAIKDSAYVVGEVTKHSGSPVHMLLYEDPIDEPGMPRKAFVERLLRFLQTRQVLSGPAEAYSTDSAIVAFGCAVYQARRDAGLPTYFDYLPRLDVNATVECRQQFVALMPTQSRIAGGSRYGPERADISFAVSAGAREVRFLIARDEKVRATVAQLPQPPQHDVRIELWVSQAPAQGNAQVEVRPVERGLFGGGTILLDWRRNLETTDKTRFQIEQEWRAQGLPFPESEPTTGHWALWAGLGLQARIVRFLAESLDPASPSKGYRSAVDALYKGLSTRAFPAFMQNVQCHDSGSYRAVGSDGALPDHLDEKLHFQPNQPPGLPPAAELYASMLEKVGKDFQAIQESECLNSGMTQLAHRRLFLIAAWCYGSAPEPVLAYFRKVLQGKDVCNKGYAVEQASRSLSRASDIRLYFSTAFKTLYPAKQPEVEGQMRWIKGAAQILLYREDAPLCLARAQAVGLARAAAEAINIELGAHALAQKFYWSVMLLLLVLRFRRQDCDFLRAGWPVDQQVLGELEYALNSAQEAAKKKHPTAAPYIRAAREFLHFRGTDVGVIKMLAAEAGD